jgi:hypothetical protein
LQEPPAPVFGRMKMTIILLGRRTAGFKELADRLGVDLPHESAD